MPYRTFFITALAMIAFAGNSILCRVALGEERLDAASFSSIRLVSGALALFLILRITEKKKPSGDWASATTLFLYAVPFSFAYLSLTTGTGALILFCAVQLTMMIIALARGERPAFRQWVGLALALSGLVYLVLPGLEAPPLAGSLLMVLSGMSWGIYSVLGKKSSDPLATTTGNFLRAIPLTLTVSVLLLPQLQIEVHGFILAMISGALTSGVGYAIWYSAIKELSSTRAAIVQLTVPVLAAGGGLLFLGEGISTRLIIASIIILGGVALALTTQHKVKAM